MRSIRRTTDLALAFAGATLALSAASCDRALAPPIAAAHEGEGTPERGGTLRLASFGDIRRLDPAVSADLLAGEAIELMFAGLVDYDRQGNVVPDLASRYEVSQDGLVYRFFLREGVRFHDGDEVTAADVVRSIERALHPSTPNPISSFYEMIEGYKAYVEKGAPHLEGVIEDGRYVVAVHLHERDARFLPAFALQNLRPVCKSGGDRYEDGWLPCGAGPFKLEPGGWDRGRSLTLVRHDGYFLPGRPYLDAVSWTYANNIGTELFKFQDGDLDVLRDMNQADATRFRVDGRWKPLGDFDPDRTVSGESMNTQMAPFDNVEVRRAVAAAVNREEYHLLRPLAVEAAGQILPPAVPGYDPTFVGQRYDYAAALEHMKNAGYPYDPSTGKGGYEPHVTYYAYRQGLSEYTAPLLQQQLAKIGIRLDIKMVNYATLLALAGRRGQAQMSAPGWGMDYPDPSDFFDLLFDSAGINEEGSLNSSFYSNPRLDAILEDARRELDTRRRYALYGEANRIVCDDAPWAITHYYRYFLVHQPYVKNFRPHAVWSDYVSESWLDRSVPRMALGTSVWSDVMGLYRQASVRGARP